MDSHSNRLLERQSSVHEFFGGGIVADVILWREKDVTVGILIGTLFAWVVFELSGHTLMSLAGRVLLLLISILYVWAKAAGVLNRPPPPIPRVHLSEEVVIEAAQIFCSCFNAFFLAAYNVALGKDSKLFYKSAACFGLIAAVGSFTDFVTVAYTSVVLVLTLPALYEKFEHPIASSGISAYMGVKQVFMRVDSDFCKIRKRVFMKIQKIKLS